MGATGACYVPDTIRDLVCVTRCSCAPGAGDDYWQDMLNAAHTLAARGDWRRPLSEISKRPSLHPPRYAQFREARGRPAWPCLRRRRRLAIVCVNVLVR